MEPHTNIFMKSGERRGRIPDNAVTAVCFAVSSASVFTMFIFWRFARNTLHICFTTAQELFFFLIIQGVFNLQRSPQTPVRCDSFLWDVRGDGFLLQCCRVSVKTIRRLTAWLSKTFCVPKFCYHSGHFTVRVRTAKCFKNSRRRFRMRSNVREWRHYLPVNIPCSHAQSFCATADSSSLATRVTPSGMSRGKLRESIIQGEHFLISFL
jgi:hypothetical protein